MANQKNCSFVATVPSTHAGASSEAPIHHYGLHLTKPVTFLRLQSPGHERVGSCIHEASLVLRAMTG